MKRVLIAAALMALSGPALAEGWYADFGGSYGFFEEETIKDGIIPGGRGELAVHDGFGVTTALGYAWQNGLRTEAELGYRRNSLDKVSGGAFGTAFTGDVDGHVSAFSGMANVLYDYQTRGDLTPYIGAGIGAADVTVVSDRLRADDSDLVFAYQFMGGVRYALTNNLSVRAGYRFFATTTPEIQGSTGEYLTHNVELGLTIGF
jgi:opacity protein-like surface antigen